MSRQQPAIFHAEDALGRTWTIRVGPLGIEAITHNELSRRRATHGQERMSLAWRDLLPTDDGGRHDDA